MFLLVMTIHSEAFGTVMPSGGHPLPNHPPPGPFLMPCSQAPSIQQHLTGVEVVSMGTCIGMAEFLEVGAQPSQASPKQLRSMKRKVPWPGLTPQCTGVQMEACTWLPEPPTWNSGSLVEKQATVIVIMDSCSSMSWTTPWMVPWITVGRHIGQWLACGRR